MYITNISKMLHNKFRGSLAGVLIGDCLGAPFEGEFPISKTIFNNYIGSHMNYPTHKGPILDQSYTDDTAMTFSLAKSLIEKKDFDPTDLAKKFTESYFQQPKRGYGQNIVYVFSALRNQNFTNVYEPAQRQFDGRGSYGNGGAMRIAPVALLYHINDELLVEIAKKSTLITHYHKNGILGATLQALAIKEALLLNPLENFDPLTFLQTLIQKLEPLEKSETGGPSEGEDSTPFCQQLNTIKKVLQSQENPLDSKEAAVLLGNSVSALKSVPSAIYSFLRCQQDLEDFKTDSLFLRTLYFAISLGGDTDTIASMACAIAGAYLGYDKIPQPLTKHCEGMEECLHLADELYTLYDEIKDKIQAPSS